MAKSEKTEAQTRPAAVEGMAAVVVTTEHRGVFFGYIPRYSDGTGGEGIPPADKLVLREARNVLYWSSEVNGFLGLAGHGPDSKCKIGPPVPALTLYGITSIAECAAAALARWEALA